MLNALNERLKENYYQFSFSDTLKKYILDSAYSDTFGARPIKRFIQNKVETIIATAIIGQKVDINHKYLVDYKNDTITIDKV